MQTRIRGARVIDPNNIDQKKDIVVEKNRILSLLDPVQEDLHKDTITIDAQGMVVVPGLIDVHVHLREPGHEYKETIETGLKAAVRGGFTAVCSMPNTRPVNDNSQVTQFILQKAKDANLARVFPTGAISHGSEGNTLAEISDMKNAGIVAVTDDGLPVKSSKLMRRALEYCKGLGLPVFSHAEDQDLADGGAMNEGPTATFYGIRGIPNASESIMVARDVALAELTGAHIHICHVSCAESVEIIRHAKSRQVNVTCETAPHYFTLTDEDVINYNTNFKMNPPLRSGDDREAIIKGLVDGTIDVIASDHAPHSSVEKDLEFDQAAFGIIGLETSLPLSLKLVQDNILTFEGLINKMSKNPAKLIGIENDILPGSIADLTIIDPESLFEINSDDFQSKSRNTPFHGRKVRGRAFLTMVDGQVVYDCQ